MILFLGKMELERCSDLFPFLIFWKFFYPCLYLNLGYSYTQELNKYSGFLFLLPQLNSRNNNSSQKDVQ
jgi:hypothetical protein